MGIKDNARYFMCDGIMWEAVYFPTDYVSEHDRMLMYEICLGALYEASAEKHINRSKAKKNKKGKK